MTVVLDMRTLVISYGVTTLTLAGVMVYFSLTRRTYPGFYHWTAGFVATGIGGVLLSLRNIVPDFVSIIVANMCIVGLPFLLVIGMTIFVNSPRQIWTKLIVLVLLLAGLIWFTYFDPSLKARIITLNLACIWLFSELTLISLRRLPTILSEPNWLLVLACLSLIVIFGLRCVLTIFGDEITGGLMSLSSTQGLMILGMILGVIGIMSSLIIVNAQRMECELLETEQEILEKTLDLEKANRKLEALSKLDGLTGLYNRRYFDSALENESRRLQRSELPLSLIMADIDYFKEFNDTYGHLAGDDCIRSVARAILQAVGRVSDVAARYGGEEFVVLLPNTDSDGAEVIAKSIRDIIREMAIPHSTSMVCEFVTISFGVATMIPDNYTPPDTLVALADQALYRSKENGRDRITVNGNQLTFIRPELL